MLSVQMLEAELKQPIILPNDELNLPRVSGSLAQHYAPHTPAFLMESHRLESWIRDCLHSHRLGILARQPPPPDLSSLPLSPGVTLENTPEPYAREMYDALRRLDAMRLDLLGIEAAPQSDDWRGIADRLHRATAKQHTLEGSIIKKINRKEYSMFDSLWSAGFNTPCLDGGLICRSPSALV